MNTTLIHRRDVIKTLWRQRTGNDTRGMRLSFAHAGSKEKRELLARLGTRIDDSNVMDEEIRGFAPTIADCEMGHMPENESRILLTKAEKASIQADLLAARLRYAIVLRN